MAGEEKLKSLGSWLVKESVEIESLDQIALFKQFFKIVSQANVVDAVLSKMT